MRRWQYSFPTIVIEFLPWEYPNLTFYSVFAALNIKHYIFAVDGADAYSSMDIDIESFVNSINTKLIKNDE